MAETLEQNIFVRITPRQRAWLDKQAQEQDRSLGYIVRQIIEAAYQAEMRSDYSECTMHVLSEQ